MKNVIVFTLCSNNYLAHAKTLGDSLKRTNPGLHFVIGLVDEIDPGVDYGFFNAEILPFDKLECPDFPSMIRNYNVIEFNTAVKPFYISYFFNRYGENSLVYYIDPDIVFYNTLDEVHELLLRNNFIVTPHLTKPHLPISPYETMVLNVGIYNLGFFGIRNTAESISFLTWWQERLKTLCYIDYGKGLFVDQIWINFLPLFFSGVHILNSPNYNMAVWNFHERQIISQDTTFYVNDFKYPLVFFHFSGFKPKDMTYLGKIKAKEFTFEARPDVKEIFQEYAQLLKSNNLEKFSALKPRLKFAAERYTKRQRIGLSLKFRANSFIKEYFGI